ncbi:MAG: glycosyltransferase family 4 protein [Nitrososphaeria archaeon]
MSRIAVFVECFPPKMGSDRRIYEIMKNIDKQKHTINFIVLPNFRKLIDGTNMCKFLNKFDKKIEGITVHFINIPQIISKLFKYNYKIAYLLAFPFMLYRSVKFSSKISPNIILCNYPSIYTGLIGWITGKLLRSYIIMDFNDLIAQYAISIMGIKKNSLTANFLILMQNFLLKNSDKIVTVTYYLKRYAINLGIKKNIVVIPNGTDTELFNPIKYNCKITALKELKNFYHPCEFFDKFSQYIKDYNICMYTGRLEKWAGVELLVKLSEKFKNTDTILICVGKEEGSPIEFKDTMILLRQVPYEIIPVLLSLSDVILIPFPRNEVSHAASPLKLFDAMAMAKPVIASKVIGTMEVISQNENGLVVEPDNVDEWYTAILNILKNKSLAIEMGKRARNIVVNKYDWRILAKKFEELLDK